jgi:hypothetical protein
VELRPLSSRRNTDSGCLKEEAAEKNMWIQQEEETGVWRNLGKGELHNLHSSPYISLIKMIK